MPTARHTGRASHARQRSPAQQTGFLFGKCVCPVGLLVLARESAKPAGRNELQSVGLPKMAALEEGFTLSAVPLGAGPHGLLGVEQSDKADQFLVTDGGRTVILYKVRVMWSESAR